MQQVKRHIFAFLAFASFLLALLSFFVFERGALGASEEKYFSAVKERVKQELDLSHKELGEIMTIASQNSSRQFSAFRRPTKYPYYIFQNGHLVFWSDYRFIPDYESIRKIAQTQLVTFEQGKFLVSRRQLVQNDTRLDVVSVINLYSHYKNKNNYFQSGYNTELFSIDPQQISTRLGPIYSNVLDNNTHFLFSITPPQI